VLFVAAAGVLSGPGAVKDVVVRHVPLVDDEPDENDNENERDDDSESENENEAPEQSEGADSAGPLLTIAVR
jgi:hypothetical protein